MKLGFVPSPPGNQFGTLRCSPDVRAGWLSAIIMMPQAVILAALAGVPPEMGVYASVFPVIIAALFGASGKLLSGPNTTVCVMIAASLIPLATPASAEYIALVLVLSAMVGAIQLLAALLHVGKLFQAIPEFIVQGVTAGVGLVIVSSQLPAMLGVLAVPGEAPWMYLLHAVAALPRTNVLALAVALLSIAAGVLFTRLKFVWLPPLIAAMMAGTGMAFAVDVLAGSGSMSLERVGHLSLQMLPLSVPTLQWEEFYIFKQLLISAIAIAFMSTLQTVIIARWISTLDNIPIRPNRELFAQGAANMVASFTGAFAGSGSFNRSAAHVHAGAETRAAAVMSAVFLFALVFAIEPLIAHLPTAAMAGTLALIGWGLVRSAIRCKHDNRRQRIATWLVAVGVLVVGLEAAVFWSSAVALACFLWRIAEKKADLSNEAALKRRSSDHPG